MLGYVKHQKSLVSKGKKTPSSSSSPSKPPAVHPTTPVAPPPPPPPKLKQYVHSFLSDFLSQSGQLGTNPFFAAPSAVPNSASLLREVAGGLGADSPTAVPPIESSGKVLPMTQVDLPPPDINGMMCP